MEDERDIPEAEGEIVLYCEAPTVLHRGPRFMTSFHLKYLYVHFHGELELPQMNWGDSWVDSSGRKGEGGRRPACVPE